MTEEESLRRRIGQLLAFGFDGLTASEQVKDWIGSAYLGNVVLFSHNVRDIEQVTALTQLLQKTAEESGQDLPLSISADQENGIVSRLPEDIPGLPGNMAICATGDPENAFRAGQATATILRKLGINCDLAPVLDVNSNPDNPVIGVRSFGDRAESVAQFGVQFVLGLQSQGIIACGKHFPGHGDTTVDSHLNLPIISRGREQLREIDLMPFKAAIDAGIDSIMTAHVAFPAMESEPQHLPATLSYRILTELLRHELGFEGVVATDSLGMNAISKTVGVGPGAVLALKAGADLIMVAHQSDQPTAALQAIMRAVDSGQLSEARVNQAYQRVRAMKMKRLASPVPVPSSGWPVLLENTRTLQTALAESAVTVLRNSGQGLPRTPQRLAVLIDSRRGSTVAANPGDGRPVPQLGQTIRQVLPQASVSTYLFSSSLSEQSRNRLMAVLQTYEGVVIGINGTGSTEYTQFVNALYTTSTPAVTLLLGNPYDARSVSQAPNLWALYENTPWMMQAAVRAVFGGRPTRGRLPVRVSDLLKAN